MTPVVDAKASWELDADANSLSAPIISSRGEVLMDEMNVTLSGVCGVCGVCGGCGGCGGCGV